MFNKIDYFIQAKTNNPNDYYEKYIKIRINSGKDLSLLMYNMVLPVRSVFNNKNKYCPQEFFEKCAWNHQKNLSANKKEKQIKYG